jgi:hypothetical protein
VRRLADWGKAAQFAILQLDATQRLQNQHMLPSALCIGEHQHLIPFLSFFSLVAFSGWCFWRSTRWLHCIVPLSNSGRRQGCIDWLA